MRTWALPKNYHATSGAHLMAYRVRAREPNQMKIPDGCYVAIRMRDQEHDMRIIVGPFDPDEARDLLETAGPRDLVDLLQRATETPNPHDTLH